MRINVKTLILAILGLGVVGVVIWHLLFNPREMASFEELQQEFDKELLSAKERLLLDTFTDYLQRGVQDSAAAVVIANQFPFRGVFEKTLQNALWLKLEEGKPDSSILVASAIAQIYEKNLNDGFLQREFAFCDALHQKDLRRKLEGDLLYNKGQKSLGQEDYVLARQHYENSLKISRKIRDARREVDNLLKIQYILYMKGDHKKALQICRTILDIARQISYQYREAWALFSVALIRFDLGEYREALSELEIALAIAHKLKDQTGEMKILGRIVIANRRLGDFSKALSAHHQALELCQLMGDQREELKLYNDRGLIHKNMGDLTKAQEDFERAFKMAEALNTYDRAIVLVNLGELHRLLGDYDAAIHHHFQALELNEQSGNYYDIALTQKAIGDVFLDQDDYDKALKHYRQALRQIEQGIKGADEITPQRLESEIWLSIGDVNKERKEWELAVDSYQRAYNTFEKIEFQEGIVHALTRIGNALRETKSFDVALESFDKALMNADRLQDPLLLSNTYYGMGLTYRDQEKLDAAEQAFGKAIELIELTRKKILGDKRINYFATIQDIYDETILLMYRQSKYETAFNFSERSRARAFLDAFEENSPNLTLSPTLSEIQNGLDENVQLIEYKVTPDKLIMFIVDRHGLEVGESPISRQELAELITEYRKTIGAEADSAFKQRVKSNPKELFQNTLQIAKKLYAHIIGPIENKISSEKVVYIVPDDMLFYLPFATLVSPQGGHERFLIEDFSLAYTPSASILAYCFAGRKPSIPPSQMKVLAIGNPLGDLPASEREARMISTMYPDADALIGEFSTKDGVIKAVNKGVNIIHFATHAIIDEKSPLYSYLILARKARLGNGTAFSNSANGAYNQDDLLMPQEIFNLNLTETRLVTLSACKTAKGRFFRGEGIVGLTRAFMGAGASSVITSLWNIDDKYTEKIMTSFYAQWQQSEVTKVQALRTAQLKILTEMAKDRVIKYPHPYAWAAFTLTGDYQ